MSKALFGAAKELIAEKNYAEARAILRIIDDPKAREWEARLAILDPQGEVNRRSPILKVGKRIATVVGIIIFLGLSVVAIVANMPQLTPQGRRTMTAVAVNDHFHATQTAIPTRTSTPTRTPTNGPTEWAYVTQTRVSRNDDQTATRVTDLETMMAPLTKTAAAKEAKATVAALTRTSTPTPAVTLMSPTTYYVLDNSGTLKCPFKYCLPGHLLRRGMPVVVVGTVDGDFNPLNSNKWYIIEITDKKGTVYEYLYAEWFSLTPPTDDQHSVFIATPRQHRTQQPDVNIGPSLTPLPTRTREP